MAKIGEKDREVIRQLFAQKMEESVYIRFFGKAAECEYCSDTAEILQELAELSDKIDLQLLDMEKDAEDAARLGVDKAPATVFVTAEGADTGVRFYGIPSGYEFSSLVEDITDISSKSTELSSATIERLKGIEQDVHLQVFVTPT